MNAHENPTPAELAELLDELAARSVAVERAGDGLKVAAPRGAVDEDLRARLAATKPGLLEHLAARAVADGPVPALPRDGRTFPLMPSQRGLWLVDRTDGHRATYVLTGSLTLHGAVDEDRLRDCLHRLPALHEPLSTALRAGADGHPEQVVLDPAPVEITSVDLRHLDPAGWDAATAEIAAKAAETPFDLAGGRLMRASIVRCGERDTTVLLSVHHVAADAWSLGVLVEDLLALYDGADVPARSPQYADIARWRHDGTSPVDAHRSLARWRRRLDGAPAALGLPTDHPRPAQPQLRGDVVAFDLDPALSTAVDALAERTGSTPFTVLIAAWSVVLARWSGVDDLVVGTPVADRGRPEAARLVGYFIDTVPLRMDLTGDPTFTDVLARTRRTALDALDDRGVPFERMVADLAPERTPGLNPIFQVMFVQYAAPAAPDSTLRTTVAEVHSGTSKFDLTLLVEDRPDGRSCRLEFSTELFRPDTAARLAAAWRHVLGAVVDDPDRPLSAVPLVDGAERAAELDRSRGRRTAADPRAVDAIVADRAADRPDAVAVVDTDGSPVTFAELDAHADRIATTLRRRGAGPDVLVALCLPRSAELLAAMVGVLRSRAAFVALDPSAPADRIAYALADSATPLLLTRRGVLPDVTEPAGTARLLLDDPDALDAPSDADRPPAGGAGPDDLAYVIYTSGSTGAPKAVAMVHRGLSNMVAWQVGRTPFGPDDRTLQFAPLTFDICLQECFGTWAGGGAVVTVEEPVRRDPIRLLDHVRDAGVTRLFLPFAVFQQVAEVAAARDRWPDRLRDVFVAGEQLFVSPPVAAFFRAVPARLHNHYGPTEAHVVAAHTLTGPPDGWPDRPPVGHPIDNVDLYLLDAAGEPVPAGVVGEVHVGGRALARGYLGRPELTAAAFVDDPFSDAPGARLYRTGDLARRDADGALEFLGRSDDQVKIRGFRVEPGEVEAELLNHPSVVECVAGVTGEGTDRRLVAWVVPRDGADTDPQALRAHCRTRLPEYLVPSAVAVLDALPLSVAGKVDRSALPEPVVRPRGQRPPSTPTERTVAGLVEQILGVPRVHADDDVFDLGGSSLDATRLALRLATTFDVGVSAQTVFARPTVAALADAVDALAWVAAPAPAPADGATRDTGEL